MHSSTLRTILSDRVLDNVGVLMPGHELPWWRLVPQISQIRRLLQFNVSFVDKTRFWVLQLTATLSKIIAWHPACSLGIFALINRHFAARHVVYGGQMRHHQGLSHAWVYWYGILDIHLMHLDATQDMGLSISCLLADIMLFRWATISHWGGGTRRMLTMWTFQRSVLVLGNFWRGFSQLSNICGKDLDQSLASNVLSQWMKVIQNTFTI